MTVLPAVAEEYRARRTWLQEVRQLHSWQMKVYAITQSGNDLTAGVLDAACGYAFELLKNDSVLLSFESSSSSAETGNSEHGFLVIHEGTNAVWLLLQLWQADILHQHLFRAPLQTPTQFTLAKLQGGAACVWELEVIKHERDAWVEYVLAQPESPRFDLYRSAALSIAEVALH